MRRTRELTAAVLIPLVLALLVWGPLWSWALLVGLACGAALWEFHGARPRLAGGSRRAR